MSDEVKRPLLAAIFSCAAFIGIIAAIALIAFALCSCTTSVTTITTRGTAEDVVDENQTATPNISPKLSVPLK